MKKQRATKGAASASAPARTMAHGHGHEGKVIPDQPTPPMPERWCRLATGLRGVRLFRVTLPSAGQIFWEAECTLNGGDVARRFASELHARAWLSVATQPRMTLSSVEKEELHRPCSSSCFASGG
ncbi:MAG TPA: hypothetical protein VGM64_09220 [Lacunisphaera sp.]|jgi:hypothetical protein